MIDNTRSQHINDSTVTVAPWVQLTNHCCACAGICYHVGGPFYCDQHNPTKNVITKITVIPNVSWPLGEPAPREGWLCTRCKRSNAPHVDTCRCSE